MLFHAWVSPFVQRATLHRNEPAYEPGCAGGAARAGLMAWRSDLGPVMRGSLRGCGPIGGRLCRDAVSMIYPISTETQNSYICVKY